MTDYQTRQRKRNMVVGLFVVFAIITFFAFLWRFRDLPLIVSKMNSFEVLVYFPEAPGVQKDTPVQYCGYQIGRVMKVAPPQLREGSHKVGVTMSIENKYADIPDQVEIVVMKRGLGSSFIELRLDPDKISTPQEYLTDKTVKNDGQVGMASDFFPPDVQAALPNLVDAIANLTNNINAVIGDPDNQASIKKTLNHLEESTIQLEKTLRSIEEFSNTSAVTVQTLGDRVILVTEQLEAGLSQTRQLMAKIESGDGTVGKLVNDGRLYENLLESSQELQILLEQLNQWADEVQEKGVKVKTKLF
jgi:phospholipid/cholesterol/gamma-HCH transport system substrate-binding protein